MRDIPTLAIETSGSQRFRLPLALSCAALILALFVPSHLALGNAAVERQAALVRQYEAGTRGRKTILNKIAQLQAS